MLNFTQIVKEISSKIQGYYFAIASLVSESLSTTIFSPRTTEDILLAHILFKTLIKCALWSYQRAKGPDQEQVDQWVRMSFDLSSPCLNICALLVVRTFQSQRRTATSLDREEGRSSRVFATRPIYLESGSYPVDFLPHATYLRVRQILSKAAAAGCCSVCCTTFL